MNNYTRINHDKSIALYFSVLTCIAKDTETLNVGGSRVSSARTLRPFVKLMLFWNRKLKQCYAHDAMATCDLHQPPPSAPFECHETAKPGGSMSKSA
jgi:hypothetical protein